jgi:pyrroline-5-carboxylate reductase
MAAHIVRRKIRHAPIKRQSAMTRETALAGFNGTLVLVGAGKMGGALLEGWHRLGLALDSVVALEPHPSPEIATLGERGLRINPELDTIDATAIVIAVKPQVAPDVLPPLAPLVGEDTVTVSVMAGRTLGFLEKTLSAKAAIVRAMPNTPAAIGRGVTVAVPNWRVTAAQRALAHALLAAAGAVEWVADEALMDAVTAVSGSGPAYVFLLAESLAKAGAAAGLPADLAARLARETVAGAGELLHRSPLDPATLRKNVTSPGGTTAAALDVLMSESGLDPVLERAVAAATRRSRKLAG